METKIKQILRQAYIEYGDEVFGDCYKLNAYISDLLAEYPSEQKRLAVIVKENIVSKVIAEKSFEINRFLVYSEMLSDTYGMQKDVAHKLLGYIFYALTGENYEVNVVEEKTVKTEIKDEIQQIGLSKTVEEVLDELYKNYNFELEERYFQKIYDSAQKGNPDAQFRIGRCYDNGLHVKEDKKEANKWYTLAAEQNHPPALLNLGHLYDVAGAKEKAITYYEKALEYGENLGGYNLGLKYVSQFNKTKEEKYCDMAIGVYKKVLQKKDPEKFDPLYVFFKVKSECALTGATVCSQMSDIYSMLYSKINEQIKSLLDESSDNVKIVDEYVAELEKKKSSKGFFKKLFDGEAEEKVLEELIEKHRQKAYELSKKAETMSKDSHNMVEKQGKYVEECRVFVEYAKQCDEECKERLGVSAKDIEW